MDIIENAKTIKAYCEEHTYNEEQCPFFMGYKKENGVNVVCCKLNNGPCSPCNWEI